jgi:hypothetical protein
MSRPENTVFISYRRSDLAPALLLFKELTGRGYDVFIDFDGLTSGDFEGVILENINARAHFLLLLTPTALDRCDEPGDGVRMEIDAAIRARRNIVPLLFPGFDFANPSVAQRLTGSLATLRKYNGLPVHLAYLDEALNRLCQKYLAVPVEAVLHPASAVAVQAAQAQQAAAEAAAGPAIASAAAAPADSIQARHAGLRKTGVVVMATALVLLGIRQLFGLSGDAPPAAPPAPVAPAQAAAPSPPAPQSPAGQIQRGDDHRSGSNGVAQDDRQAVEWYRKAALQGDATGQVRLGFMHENGSGGLLQDGVQAAAWYRLAAAQGNGEAGAALKRLGEAP